MAVTSFPSAVVPVTSFAAQSIPLDCANVVRPKWFKIRVAVSGG